MCWGGDEVLSSVPEGDPFVALSGGWEHTCGLREDGTAVCWHFFEDRLHWSDEPPEGETFAALSSGHGHTCGLRENGSAVCWGSDEDGQASPPCQCWARNEPYMLSWN